MTICIIDSEFYEPGAMLIEDEGMVIPGLLVGLNVIDCNICIKEEDLDQPVSRWNSTHEGGGVSRYVIDCNIYMKEEDLDQPVNNVSGTPYGGHTRSFTTIECNKML